MGIIEEGDKEQVPVICMQPTMITARTISAGQVSLV